MREAEDPREMSCPSDGSSEAALVSAEGAVLSANRSGIRCSLRKVGLIPKTPYVGEAAEAVVAVVRGFCRERLAAMERVSPQEMGAVLLERSTENI